MKNHHVLALVGGISKASINQRLYHEVVRLNTQKLTFSTFDLATLPFYSQDIESNYPPNAVAFKNLVKQADAILIITPEYNRSMPGVLKNALDLASRPYGTNAFDGKPAAIMGASIGNIGTFGAQQHLRNVCSFLNMHLMSQPEFYFNASTAMTDKGVDEKLGAFIGQFLSSFAGWIEVCKK